MEYCTSDLMKTSNTLLNLRRLEQNSGLWPKTTSKTSWKDTHKYSPLVHRRHHVGDGVDEEVERLIVEACRYGWRQEHFDGEPSDGDRCFEEGQDDVVALGEQSVAEPLQDERGEMVEIHLGDGVVARESIGDRLVV